MKRRIRSIGTRLIGSAAVVILLLVGALGVVTSYSHREDLMSHTLMHSNQLSEIVQRALYYSMLHYDRENIEETISQIGQGEGIEIARVFNKAGEIVYSSEPADVGVVVETSEEGCIQCHASEIPLVEIRHGDRSQIFSSGGTRSLSVVTPIYNEPACSAADCHPRPEEQNVLGVLYIAESLARVDQEMKRSTMFVAVFSLLIILVLSVFLAYFVRRFIRRPVMQLRRGVQRVSAGDLDYQIEFRSETELGELAIAFNSMTVDLKKARQEIEEWGHSLEDRVQQRTAELEETQAQLLQMDKLGSLGKLAASVAHEINNPLMGILTFIRIFQDWIKGGTFPPEKHEEFGRDLEIMGKETTRISKIVRNLLAFARRSKLEKSEQQINDLLRQCVELLNHQLTLQEIDIIQDLDPNLPQVNIDAGQIQQAIMNLLLNAAEAVGRHGTVTISSRLAETEPSEARVAAGRTLSVGDLPQEGAAAISIRVRDSGPGIPDEIMNKLFDPFFTTKEVGKGTGLGLPVAYGVVHKHGGTIHVSSSPGEGTEFEIVLPLMTAAAEDEFGALDGPEES